MRDLSDPNIIFEKSATNNSWLIQIVSSNLHSAPFPHKNITVWAKLGDKTCQCLFSVIYTDDEYHDTTPFWQA